MSLRRCPTCLDEVRTLQLQCNSSPGYVSGSRTGRWLMRMAMIRKKLPYFSERTDVPRPECGWAGRQPEATGNNCAPLRRSQLYNQARLWEVKRDTRICFFEGITEQAQQTYAKVCVTSEPHGPITLLCCFGQLVLGFLLMASEDNNFYHWELNLSVTEKPAPSKQLKKVYFSPT